MEGVLRMREENEKYPFKRILGKCVKEKAVLLNKKELFKSMM